MQEPNNQNLFADAEEAKKVFAKQEEEEIKSTLVVSNPVGSSANVDSLDTTVEVKFCTGGRLSAPPILHFRDYSMLASQALADLSDEENHLPNTIKALNTMVVEDFDCGKLHLEEVKEVLLNIYGKWWGDKITGYKYFINEDLKTEKELLAPENISVADIPLDNLEIVPLDPDIREPINVKCHGVTVKFVYPRVQDSGNADALLKVKFADEEQRFHKLAKIVAYNEEQTDIDKMKDVDVKELEAYEEYLKEKDKWRIIFIRAHEVCGIDDVVLKTFDERVEALMAKDSKISIKHWQKFNNFLEGKGKFGLKNEAEFFSDVLNKKVRRPFQFYTYNFIPTEPVESTGDGDDEISFG